MNYDEQIKTFHATMDMREQALSDLLASLSDLIFALQDVATDQNMTMATGLSKLDKFSSEIKRVYHRGETYQTYVVEVWKLAKNIAYGKVGK